jgi:hypothetical protein
MVKNLKVLFTFMNNTTLLNLIKTKKLIYIEAALFTRWGFIYLFKDSWMKIG